MLSFELVNLQRKQTMAHLASDFASDAYTLWLGCSDTSDPLNLQPCSQCKGKEATKTWSLQMHTINQYNKTHPFLHVAVV